MPEYLLRPEGLPPTNGFSHAVVFTGRQIAVSGQVPLTADATLAGEDAETQIRQVFANLRTALAAAGAGFEHVVKLTYFLTDLADVPVLRAVRDEHIDPQQPPASSLIQVAGLVDPRFRVEIEALAAV
ncbi:RidA family protein [Amycolatopsis ultiminotia]|uniref:RidA family protein n=1 Tax=Amycolatopsis ultiminotia TaxID=543629 RepID=A0ABP6WM72_9PSEU